MAEKYMIKEQKWELQYSHDIGEIASKFFVELRDNGKIMATKCSQCNRVYMPPRSYCERCFIPLKDQWIELSGKGTLQAFTIVTPEYKIPDMLKPPYVIALVKLEGASTAIVQLLDGINLTNIEKAAKQLKVGTPVKAVFKPKQQRQGRIQDFHFELAGPPAV